MADITIQALPELPEPDFNKDEDYFIVEDSSENITKKILSKNIKSVGKVKNLDDLTIIPDFLGQIGRYPVNLTDEDDPPNPTTPINYYIATAKRGDGADWRVLGTQVQSLDSLDPDNTSPLYVGQVGLDDTDKLWISISTSGVTKWVRILTEAEISNSVNADLLNVNDILMIDNVGGENIIIGKQFSEINQVPVTRKYTISISQNMSADSGKPIITQRFEDTIGDSFEPSILIDRIRVDVGHYYLDFSNVLFDVLILFGGYIQYNPLVYAFNLGGPDDFTHKGYVKFAPFESAFSVTQLHFYTFNTSMVMADNILSDGTLFSLQLFTESF